MSQAIARRILLNRLKTIEFEGITGKFDPPKITYENINHQAENRQPFIRFTFVPSETQILTIAGRGNALKQHQGQAMVSLFVPRGTGVTQLYKWADKIIAAYPASTDLIEEDGQVWLRNAWAETVREEDDWAQLIVAIRWKFLEQQTQ